MRVRCSINRLLLSLLLLLLVSFAAAAQDAAPVDLTVGQKTLANLRAEIVALIDKAALDNTLRDVDAFALKSRLDQPKDLAVPAGDSAPLVEARAKIEMLRGLQGDFDSCEGLTNDALKTKLRAIISCQKSLGYNGARTVMFKSLDNVGGQVACRYTGRKVACNGIPSATGTQSMNTEHTWPKSLGAGQEPAICDLNHLYATDSYANSTRSSYPFGEITHAVWEQGGSRFDGGTFEPRADHRGNVARSLFYFSVRYGKPIDATQEKWMRKWHKDDPVDAQDKARNEGVFAAQGNRNPFIDRPDFVDKIQDF